MYPMNSVASVFRAVGGKASPNVIGPDPEVSPVSQVEKVMFVFGSV